MHPENSRIVECRYQRRRATPREVLLELQEPSSIQMDDLVAFCDRQGLGQYVTFRLEFPGAITATAER